MVRRAKQRMEWELHERRDRHVSPLWGSGTEPLPKVQERRTISCISSSMLSCQDEKRTSSSALLRAHRDDSSLAPVLPVLRADAA